MPISEKEYARIKRLKTKKGRQKDRKFMVEGIRCLQELVSSDYQVDRIYLCEKYLTDTGRSFLEQNKNLRYEPVVSRHFDQLISEKSSQGILAVANQKKHEMIIPARTEMVLLAERMSDPSNLGSVIRSAVSFGVPLIIGPRSAELYSPKVVSASSGFIFKAVITVSPALPEQLNLLKQKGFIIYGADRRGVNIRKISPVGKKVALIIGNEAFGLSQELRQKIDKTVTIPIRSEVDSLSAPVAAGILLYALSDRMRKIK